MKTHATFARLLACLIFFPAFLFAAAEDRATLKNDVAAVYASNKPGGITAADLRLISTNLIDSAYNPLDDGAPVLLSGSYANPAWITSLHWSKIVGSPIMPIFPDGTIVGTTDAQVIANKTISGANNTLSVRLQDFTQSGATTGQVPVWNGSQWAPGTVSGGGGSQVNSDWNASSGVAQILNKPTLAPVATSGAYGDLSGRPALATVATSGAYTDLSGRPTLGTAAPLNVAATGDAAAGEVVKGNDSRLTNSRAPNGSAGGDLAGTFPNPTLGTSGVTAGSYGSSSAIPVITVDAKGRITSASTAAISGGGGGGDMLKSVYDSNDDGKVTSAVSADAVPWTGVTGKPTFAAVATSGSATDLSTGTLPAARLPAFTGDATSSAGASALTLATSGVTAGTYGSGTQIPVITVDAKGRITAASTSSVSGSSTSSIRQTYVVSNSFVPGNAIYRTAGGAWALARANAQSTSEAIGIVESASGTQFTVVFGGEITLSGLTPGAIYYVSAATAGLLTAVEPVAVNEISKPLMVAVSSSLGVVTNQRAVINDLQDQSANTVFAGPSSGGAAQPAFRTLVAADVPSLTLAKISDAGSVASRAATANSVGAADSGKVPYLDATGKLDSSVIPAGGGTNATQIQGVNVANISPTNGQVFKYVSANSRWEPAADSTGGGTGTKSIGRWTARSAQPTNSNGTYGKTVNDRFVQVFDPTTEKTCTFQSLVQQGMSSPDVVVTLVLAMDTATSGVVTAGVSIENGTGQVLTSDGYATERLSTETGVPGTAKTPFLVSVTFSNAQADAITAGDYVRVKVAIKTSGYSGTKFSGECFLVAAFLEQQ